MQGTWRLEAIGRGGSAAWLEQRWLHQVLVHAVCQDLLKILTVPTRRIVQQSGISLVKLCLKVHRLISHDVKVREEQPSHAPRNNTSNQGNLWGPAYHLSLVYV